MNILNRADIGLSATGYAQVYKSIDAEGNVVYSDQPPVAGGEEIEVPEANVADSVEVPASVSSESTPEPTPKVTVEETPQPEVVVSSDDGDDDDGTSQKLRKAKIIKDKKKGTKN